MGIRRTSRRRRARRAAGKAGKVVRGWAVLKAVRSALRHRRGVGLALRGSPALLAAGAGWALLRRRRARRLEAELGPPNESAPGHRLPPPVPTPPPNRAAVQAQEPGDAPTAGEAPATDDAPVASETDTGG